MSFFNGRGFAEVKILKKVRLLQNDIYHRSRPFRAPNSEKSENDHISSTEWNILIDFCVNIDIIKL